MNPQGAGSLFLNGPPGVGELVSSMVSAHIVWREIFTQISIGKLKDVLLQGGGILSPGDTLGLDKPVKYNRKFSSLSPVLNPSRNSILREIELPGFSVRSNTVI